MEIDNSETVIKFSFKPKDWFLCKADEQKTGWPWSLNYRIDRSEKGKDDDIGIAKIFLDEKEAEEAKKAGFSWID